MLLSWCSVLVITSNMCSSEGLFHRLTACPEGKGGVGEEREPEERGALFQICFATSGSHFSSSLLEALEAWRVAHVRVNVCAHTRTCTQARMLTHTHSRNRRFVNIVNFGSTDQLPSESGQTTRG